MALTDRQRDVRDYVREYVDVWGYGPSLREIAAVFGISPEGVRKHLDHLVESGVATRRRGVARSIRVVDKIQPRKDPAG